MKVVGSDIICEKEDMKGFEVWLQSPSFMSNFRVAWGDLDDKNIPYTKRRFVLLGGTFFGLPITISDKEIL